MELSGDQEDIREPVLKAVLSRVTLGVAVILDYPTNCERRMTIPLLLQGDQIIYLWDFFVADE